jgi:uncharacterized protein YndB with AHSA1/START domain
LDPVHVNVTIDRPREEVFDYLADIANHPTFMDPLFTDWRLTRAESYGNGAGARFRTRARLDRFGWGDLNFVAVDAPWRIVAVGRGGKFNRIKTYAEWNLEPVSGGSATRVEFTFETEPPLPTDKAMETISGRRRWYRRGAGKALKRLRANLEEGRDRGQRATVAGL